jgi:hypothetical protein
MDAPYINWILPLIDTLETLSAWCPQLKGSMYNDTVITPPVPNPGAVIISTLNSIATIATTSHAGPTRVVAPIKDPHQGCIDFRAEVPWFVIFLIFLVAFVTIGMTAYWVVLTVCAKRMTRLQPSQYARLVNNNAPNGLLSWMKHAVRETGVTGGIEDKEVQGWFVGRSIDGYSIRLTRGDKSWDGVTHIEEERFNLEFR